MDIVSALVVIALLLVGATALGVVVRARSARVASGCGGDEHDLSVDGAEVTQRVGVGGDGLAGIATGQSDGKVER